MDKAIFLMITFAINDQIMELVESRSGQSDFGEIVEVIIPNYCRMIRNNTALFIAELPQQKLRKALLGNEFCWKLILAEEVLWKIIVRNYSKRYVMAWSIRTLHVVQNHVAT